MQSFAVLCRQHTQTYLLLFIMGDQINVKSWHVELTRISKVVVILDKEEVLNQVQMAHLIEGI